MAAKRQRYAESQTADLEKRSRKQNDVRKPNVRYDREKPSTSRAATTVSKIAKRHLIVALID